MSKKGFIRPIEFGYRGMTSQDSLFRDGHIAYSHNLECRDVDKGITLLNKPQLLFSVNKKVLHILENDDGDVFFFTEDGKIYNEAGTVLEDFGVTVLNVCYYDEKFIVVYRTFNNLKFASVDGDGASNKNMNYTINGDFDMKKPHEYIPMLNISDTNLYIGARRRILRVSPEGDNGFYEQSMKFERNIIGLVPSGNGIVVVLENGACYYWDGFSETYENNYNNNIYVRHVFSNTGTIFIVGGLNRLYTELYVLDGLRFQLIKTYKRTQGIETNHKFDIVTNLRASNNNHAYHLNLYYTLSGSKVLTFGESDQGFPFGYINTHRTKHDNQNIDIVYSLYKKMRGVQMYACLHDDEGNITIENLFGTNKFVSQGVVYYPLLRFGANEKRIEKVFVKYANVTNQTFIDIYYALDGGSYQLLHTLNNKVDVYKRESLYDIIQVDLVSNTYFDIQFKIVLRSVNENLAPRFYGLYFDEQNNDR